MCRTYGSAPLSNGDMHVHVKRITMRHTYGSTPLLKGDIYMYNG